MNSDSFQVAGPDIVFEDFDGDLVVLNLSTGQYFGFNPAAAKLWDAVVSGASVDGIAAACAQRDQVAPFVEKVASLGLVAPGEGPGAALAPEMAECLAQMTETPEVSVFDDLADLIVADPIHDTVEEAGWPVRAG